MATASAVRHAPDSSAVTSAGSRHVSMPAKGNAARQKGTPWAGMSESHRDRGRGAKERDAKDRKEKEEEEEKETAKSYKRGEEEKTREKGRQGRARRGYGE